MKYNFYFFWYKYKKPLFGTLSGFIVSPYDVFLQIRTGDTPQTIRFIEEKEWDLNANLNNFNWTALHLAAFQGDYKLTEYLLKRGADLHLTNSSGYTPCMLAEYKGNKDICRLLKSDASVLLEVQSSSSA